MLQHQLARFDLRKVQDIVDDAEQALARAVHGVNEAALLGTEIGALQQLRHAQHPVHRRANLVTHFRQEFGLGAVGRVGFGLGLLERDVALLDKFQHAVKPLNQYTKLVAAMLLDPYRQISAAPNVGNGVG